MRRDAVFAVCVLFGALLACRAGPSATNWAPHSVQAGSSRIAARAVSIGDGDLEIVRDAGGVFLGTLTMDEGTSGDSMEEAVADEAAQRGGTHFVYSGASETSDRVGAYTIKNRNPRYRVYRVAVGGWSSLPLGLQPKGT